MPPAASSRLGSPSDQTPPPGARQLAATVANAQSRASRCRARARRNRARNARRHSRQRRPVAGITLHVGGDRLTAACAGRVAGVAQLPRVDGPFVTGGSADEVEPRWVLAADLRRRRQESVNAAVLVGAEPAAVVVLAAGAERRCGVLGHVLTTPDRAARIPEQGIGRGRHEPTGPRVPAAPLELRHVHQREYPIELTRPAGRRLGECERHDDGPAVRVRSAATRSTAAR